MLWPQDIVPSFIFTLCFWDRISLRFPSSPWTFDFSQVIGLKDMCLHNTDKSKPWTWSRNKKNENFYKGSLLSRQRTYIKREALYPELVSLREHIHLYPPMPQNRNTEDCHWTGRRPEEKPSAKGVLCHQELLPWRRQRSPGHRLTKVSPYREVGETWALGLLLITTLI